VIRVKKNLIAGLIVYATIALGTQSRGSDIRYTVTDLGTLGGPTSVPGAISEDGTVVGNAMVSQSSNHPFIYQGNGPMQDIGLLDPVHGIAGAALSVNSRGEVVGEADAAVGSAIVSHAFYYSGSGPPVDLTPGTQQSLALWINDNSQVVGSVTTGPNTYDGMLWNIGGATIDLGTTFLPTAINNNGLMAGIATGTQHAAFSNLSSGSITDLGTFGGSKSQVNAISNTGLAVGFADTPTTSHAFLYDSNTGVLTDLGNPVSPLFYSNAADVNDFGVVVGGYQTDAAWDDAGFIYTKADGMRNLNNLIDQSAGWNITGTGGINDAGQIVGSGYGPNGFHAVLLTPVVPEPSSLLLLCVAGIGLMATRAAARLIKHIRDSRFQIRGFRRAGAPDHVFTTVVR